MTDKRIERSEDRREQGDRRVRQQSFYYGNTRDDRRSERRFKIGDFRLEESRHGEHRTG
jgi:hypothetical protein